jgi:hypothetical protein
MSGCDVVDDDESEETVKNGKKVRWNEDCIAITSETVIFHFRSKNECLSIFNKDKEVTKMNLEACEILELHAILKKLFPDLKEFRNYHKFIVRRCYRSLALIALSKLYAPVPPSHTNPLSSPKYLMLLKGIEGVGKKTFLLYILLLSICDERFTGESFGIEDSFTREVFIFRPVQGKQFVYEISRDTSVAALCRAKVKLYVILNQKPGHRHIDLNADLTIIPTCSFLVNKEDDLHEFKQYYPKDYISEYILPTWSFEELQFINNFVPSWFLKYNLYGGIPGLLFYSKSREEEQQQSYQQSKQRLKDLISESGAQAFQKMFFVVNRGNNYYKFEKQSFYKIFHFNPRWNSQKKEWNFSSFPQITFASDECFQMMTQMVSFKKIFDILFDYQSPNDPFTSIQLEPLLQSVFEKFYIWGSPIVGKVLTVSPLHSKENASSNKKPSGSPLVLPLVLPLVQLKLPYDWKLMDYTHDVLYFPSNFEQTRGMVFFLLTNKKDGTRELFFLKPTIYKTHAVDANEVLEIISCFASFKIEKINLVFLVPTRSAMSHSQLLNSASNDSLKEFHQFICFYPA